MAFLTSGWQWKHRKSEVNRNKFHIWKPNLINLTHIKCASTEKQIQNLLNEERTKKSLAYSSSIHISRKYFWEFKLDGEQSLQQQSIFHSHGSRTERNAICKIIAEEKKNSSTVTFEHFGFFIIDIVKITKHKYKTE